MNVDQFVREFELGSQHASLIKIHWDTLTSIGSFILTKVTKAGWFPNPKKRAAFFIEYCHSIEEKFSGTFDNKNDFFIVATFAILLAEKQSNDLNFDKIAFLNLYAKRSYGYGDIDPLAHFIGESQFG